MKFTFIWLGQRRLSVYLDNADPRIDHLRSFTVPLKREYVNGFEVFYISTEASDKDLADHLTNFTHSRVSFAPALKNAPPPQSLASIYVFRNGIKGSCP